MEELTDKMADTLVRRWQWDRRGGSGFAFSAATAKALERRGLVITYPGMSGSGATMRLTDDGQALGAKLAAKRGITQER